MLTMMTNEILILMCRAQSPFSAPKGGSEPSISYLLATSLLSVYLLLFITLQFSVPRCNSYNQNNSRGFSRQKLLFLAHQIFWLIQLGCIYSYIQWFCCFLSFLSVFWGVQFRVVLFVLLQTAARSDFTNPAWFWFLVVRTNAKTLTSCNPCVQIDRLHFQAVYRNQICTASAV